MNTDEEPTLPDTVEVEPFIDETDLDPPVITAVLTCDGFNTSIIDQKPSIIGVFDDIAVANFPFHMALTAVVVLVGVLEQVDVQLSVALQNPDFTETVTPFGTASIVQPPPTPQIVNTVIVHGLHTFATPGRYDLRVHGNGTFLAYKPIIIRQLQLPGIGNPPGAQQ